MKYILNTICEINREGILSSWFLLCGRISCISFSCPCTFRSFCSYFLPDICMLESRLLAHIHISSWVTARAFSWVRLSCGHFMASVTSNLESFFVLAVHLYSCYNILPMKSTRNSKLFILYISSRMKINLPKLQKQNFILFSLFDFCIDSSHQKNRESSPVMHMADVVFEYLGI